MSNLVTLRTLTLDECQQVRIWRNAPDVFPMLRTGYKTEDEQAAFYRDIVCNPQSNHRYYALERGGQFIGIGGLTYFDRVPGEAEISLVLGPDFRRCGLGTAAVDALLSEAFGPLGLSVVTGQCYAINPAREFWLKIVPKRPPVSMHIEKRGTIEWQWFNP